MSLTLRDVAQALNTTATQINRFERGERDLGFNWLLGIARVLEIPPADLLLPEDGGLSKEERELVRIFRDADERGRKLIQMVAIAQIMEESR